MPIFAVIADMHGNLPALEAVLADLAVVKPDAIYIAGDFVNRGPASGAVVARAMALGLPAISGNHDTWLAMLARGEHIPENWDDLWWQPQRLAL
ncbi:MAG TPA: metallophosphoesterase family protein, partial [Ktedonobacterales bacterium]|nr:metallophosphoesterase family protein [Ktedonobacterales bacterium]